MGHATIVPVSRFSACITDVQHVCIVFVHACTYVSLPEFYSQDFIKFHQTDEAKCAFSLLSLVVLVLTLFIRTRGLMADLFQYEHQTRSLSQCSVAVQIDGVAEVHDLHIWLIKPGMPILAAHITSTETSDANAVLGSVTHYCRSFGIDHSTIQVSDTDCPCIKQPETSPQDHHHHDHDHEQDHDHNQHAHDHSHDHSDSHSHHQQHHNGHDQAHAHSDEQDHSHSQSTSDMV